MKILKTTLREQPIFGMANVRGAKVKNPGRLPFSFLFSADDNSQLGIRVKVVFNSERIIQSKTGTLKLCDDWEFIPSVEDKHLKAKDIADMKQFFRGYLVLFCAVWDEQMQEGVLEDYFTGNTTFQEMLTDLDFYDDYVEDLANISTVEKLEEYARTTQCIDLHGN